MSKQQALYMETTKIAPEKTAGEIQELLARNGAKYVQMEYHGGEVGAIRFAIDVAVEGSSGESIERWFRLPINWRGVFRQLKVTAADRREEQAKRTAWRHVLRWLEAQLAMVECAHVEMAEVFLPYMVDQQDRSLWQLVKANQLPALEGRVNDAERIEGEVIA